MFTAYCPQHRCNVLVSVYDAMRRDAGGYDVHFTCPCGYTGWSRQPRGTEDTS
jgi:hypothetical protein